MKKLLVIKNNIIAVLCVTIIVLSIGFVLVSVKMEKLKNKKEVFNVSFSSVKQITSIKGGIVEPQGKLNISNNGKILDFSYDMYTEHDEIDYELVIANNGTVAAMINELMMSPDFNDSKVASSIAPIVINLSDISGKLLEPGDEVTVKLSVIYNSGEISGQKNVTGKIGIISESVM